MSAPSGKNRNEPTVIFNPIAGHGQSERRWPELQRRLSNILGAFQLITTKSPGDATIQARQAVDDGCKHIISVGGDGTHNEIVNGIFTASRNSGSAVVFSPLPAGTGNDLCRTLGMTSSDPEEAAFRAIERKQTRRIDLLSVRCQGKQNEIITRYALLFAAYGAVPAITARVNASRLLKRVSGRFSYLVATLLTALTYPHINVDISIDTGNRQQMRTFTGLCLNTVYAGGGMRLAPNAKIDDGQFNLIVLGDMSRWDIIFQKPDWLFAGHHLLHPKITEHLGRQLLVTGAGDIPVDIDGESVGTLPLAINTVPNALLISA